MTVRPSSRRTCGCVMVSPSSTSMSYSWTEESTVTSWSRRGPERRTRWPISPAAIGSTPVRGEDLLQIDRGVVRAEEVPVLLRDSRRGEPFVVPLAGPCAELLAQGRVRRELAQPLGQFVDVAERD